MDDDFAKRLPHAEKLNAMTAASLKAAFAGESQAAEKYLVFAMQAEEEGLTNIARLFTAISFAETRHARNHLRVLGGIGSTVDNLQTAFEGESFEIDEMYPAYAEIAKVQANQQASRSIKYALKAEQDHKRMYAEAREKALVDGDVADLKVSVCLVCGHTVIGDVPDKCPVCAAKADQYRSF
ncbi:MAG: rubrerythrin family protein [Thermoleophilia bacterium]